METAEYDNLARLEAERWWYVGMRRIAQRWVRTLRLPPGATILEAGCGTGGGLRWLAEFGTATGIDLHSRAAAHAARQSPRVARDRQVHTRQRYSAGEKRRKIEAAGLAFESLWLSRFHLPVGLSLLALAQKAS